MKLARCLPVHGQGCLVSKLLGFSVSQMRFEFTTIFLYCFSNHRRILTKASCIIRGLCCCARAPMCQAWLKILSPARCLPSRCFPHCLGLYICVVMLFSRLEEECGNRESWWEWAVSVRNVRKILMAEQLQTLPAPCLGHWSAELQVL